MEAKFFELFQVLHPVGKEAYKLELPRNWTIHNVFHMSLLEQDTIRKEQVDKKVSELDVCDKDSKEYKVKAIQNSAVYAKELECYLPGLYYLVAWKG